ncbi:PPM-type phosphatase domain-containing protein [Mycena indigotica]|uniref:PPM-type phosphatase domain-containing protein n=1 Tax=Mycena indigotica TaxID=2126181 RepID=A0A8H6S622_9AGAR|nr:PPM-type phosphatase domain-containing protein [Mycena indigotica]KAF7292890.1 PPM-type phosphatase domain-containing protein [Mycena indigotica]
MPGIFQQEIQTLCGTRISVVQFQPTSRPIEDRFSISSSSDESRLLLGVYDGHGGPRTADHISRILPEALLAARPNDNVRIFEEQDQRLLQNFEAQHPFITSLLGQKSSANQSARLLRSGCTALVLDVDLKNRMVHFANAGDCRAIVFDKAAGNHQETVDLNAKTSLEQARLNEEHPGEDDVIVGGRLFGKLMSTRGFGDGYYKLPRGFNGWKHRHYVNILSALDVDSGKVPLSAQYDSYFYGYRSPPYITATPDVGVFEFDTDKLLVCGSDGVFDLASSEEVVAILRSGLDHNADNLALYLLNMIMSSRSPGDDVTILVLQHLPLANP